MRHGCTTFGCPRKHHADGLCHTCYTARRRARGQDRLQAASQASQRQRRDDAIKRLVAVAVALTAQEHPLARELWDLRQDLD